MQKTIKICDDLIKLKNIVSIKKYKESCKEDGNLVGCIFGVCNINEEYEKYKNSPEVIKYNIKISTENKEYSYICDNKREYIKQYLRIKKIWNNYLN